MQAEVISIGDEMASGQALDTNSQWLAQRLGELGIAVICHTTVADDLAANRRVFRNAVETADIVVATGGLGPTADDLTRQVLADVAGKPLVQDDAALAHIRSLFARRKREMPAANVVQAQFPQGSSVVPNPHGTAPGIDITIPRQSRAGQARVFALPGVPAEMKEMWGATVAPELRQLAGGKVILHHRIKCFGVGESDLEAMLPDLIRRGRKPSVGITVSRATITLRITAEGSSEADCRAQMAPTIATIHECLGSLVFGTEDDELEHAVLRELTRRGETVALLEWGTAGLIAHWLGEVPARQEAFLGGVLVRDVGALRRLCDIDPATNDAALLPAAIATVRRQFGATYGLAVGPFPAADSPTTAAGEYDIYLATTAGTLHKRAPFSGHPEILKPRAAKQALNFLRLHLLNDDGGTLLARR
jgi:nicotinamide-nucleotide amidase